MKTLMENVGLTLAAMLITSAFYPGACADLAWACVESLEVRDE